MIFTDWQARCSDDDPPPFDPRAAYRINALVNEAASPFTGSLTITSLDADCQLWRLNEPLVYEIGHLGSGIFVIVEAGFITDGATTGAARMFLPAWGRYSRAAVVHDCLMQMLWDGKPHAAAETRAAADRIFHEALLVSGIWRPVAFLMWAAVRLFGKDKPPS